MQTASDHETKTLSKTLSHIVPTLSNSGFVHEFTTSRNTVTKKFGWRPKAHPGFDPVDALTTVHDCFEHFPKTDNIGGVQDEFLAQGAVLWLRLEGGFWGPFNTSKFDKEAFLQKQVPGAWGMLFATVIARRLKHSAQAPVLAEAQAPLPSRTEGILSQIITYADNLIGQKGCWGSFERLLCNLDLSQQLCCREAVMSAAPWIRLGYRLAAERYAGLDKIRLVKLFQETVKKVDAALVMEEYLRNGTSGQTIMKLCVEPEYYRTTVTSCVETISPPLSAAEQDALDLAQDDEVVGSFGQ